MKKILIVDDEFDIRETLKMFLESEGYQVEVAMNGDEGLVCVKKNAHDLIISDVMMPGLSGIELLNKVKSMPEKKMIPFILMSAASLNPNDLGAQMHSAFIRKPFDIDALLSLMKELLS